MTLRALLLAAACTLAACSPPASQSNDASKAGSAATPSTAGPPVQAIQPGQYRTTVTIMSINMPGMPASVVEKMRAQPNVSEDCVTSDDIGELTRKSLVDADEGQTCSENRITSANGRIEGTATCRNEDGGAYTMQVNGTYGANHVVMDMNMSGQTPMGPISQQMHMVTDRIGECPAGSN